MAPRHVALAVGAVAAIGAASLLALRTLGPASEPARPVLAPPFADPSDRGAAPAPTPPPAAAPLRAEPAPAATAEDVMAARLTQTAPAAPPEGPAIPLGRGPLGIIRRDLMAAAPHLRSLTAPCGAATGERATLVLEIETHDGALSVRSARASAGSGGDPRVACALAALRGVTLVAPTSTRGARLEFPLSLDP